MNPVNSENIYSIFDQIKIKDNKIDNTTVIYIIHFFEKIWVDMDKTSVKSVKEYLLYDAKIPRKTIAILELGKEINNKDFYLEDEDEHEYQKKLKIFFDNYNPLEYSIDVINNILIDVLNKIQKQATYNKIEKNKLFNRTSQEIILEPTDFFNAVYNSEYTYICFGIFYSQLSDSNLRFYNNIIDDNISLTIQNRNIKFVIIKLAAYLDIYYEDRLSEILSNNLNVLVENTNTDIHKTQELLVWDLYNILKQNIIKKGWDINNAMYYIISIYDNDIVNFYDILATPPPSGGL
jgi:hypothetical protein